MNAGLVQIIVRHIEGSRATEIDVIPLGAHRELILGRAPSAAIRFDPHRDSGVGRHHARLEPCGEPPRLRLVDLGSRNGTWVNGERVAESVELRPGDVVQLGPDGPRIQVTLEQLAPLGTPPDGK